MGDCKELHITGCVTRFTKINRPRQMVYLEIIFEVKAGFEGKVLINDMVIRFKV